MSHFRAILFSILANFGVSARISRKPHNPTINKITRDEAVRDDETAGGQHAVTDFEVANDTPNESARPLRPFGAGPSCARKGAGQRVVSMADQHGDFIAMVTHMHQLGLLSRIPRMRPNDWDNIWAGGDTIFVQIGDILDRGDDGKAMYEFLWKLQDQVPDGQVILLPGNHELLVLEGYLKYVSKADLMSYGGTKDQMRMAWDKDGKMGRQFRERFKNGKMKLAHKINDVVFVHAGLVAKLWDVIDLKKNEDPVEKLNRIAVDFFQADMKALAKARSPVNAYNGTTDGGPMWTRMCQDVDKGRCSVVKSSLQTMSASRMVIGHCITRSNLVEVGCQGQFLQTDTGVSIAYAGSRKRSDMRKAALEFYTGDTEQRMWIVYSGVGECRELEKPWIRP